jgi:transcriptional regulator with XRE-family HTH domain
MPLIVFRGAVLLREWRERRGLTQAAAAAELGIDPWYYSKIEQGRRRPGRALSETLRVRVRVPISSWEVIAEAA